MLTRKINLINNILCRACWPAVISGLAVILLTVIYWQRLLAHEDAQINRIIERDAKSLSSSINHIINQRINALDRMAKRWERRGGTPRIEWENDTANYIAHQPELQSIEWVDNNFHVRWVTPIKDNEKAENFDLSFEKHQRIVMQNARDSKKAVLTRPIDMTHDGKGFLVYVPLYVGNKFDGLILGVFRIKDLLDLILSENAMMGGHINQLYSFTIHENNGSIYVHDAGSTLQHNWLKETEVRLPGVSWKLDLWPKESLISETRSPLTKWVLLSGIFIGILLMLAVYTAISARQRKQQLELEISAHERTEAKLEEAKTLAEKANHHKSEFLSRMSHELRTPMNAIIGFGQLLQFDNQNLNDFQKEGLEHILEGGNHLLLLINEILDIAKVEAGEMKLSIVNVPFNSVLGGALLFIKPMAATRNIAIRLPSGDMNSISVLADQQRLKQVLVNLLSNAVKYNRPGGGISIEYSIPESRQDILLISITDTGLGIKEEFHGDIFEPFQRVTLRSEDTEGTGIGLTITKKMVELMGGRIGFSSEYGKGSTFWFELPIGKTSIKQTLEQEEQAIL